MAYVTVEQIRNEIIDLDNIAPDGMSASDYVTPHIANVQTEIDGRLAQIYEVPFDPVPEIIASVALAMVCYRTLRPVYVKEDPAKSDWVDESLRRAEHLLTSIEEGRLQLSNVHSRAASFNPSAIANNTSVARTFTETKIDENGNIIKHGTLDGDWRP